MHAFTFAEYVGVSRHLVLDMQGGNPEHYLNTGLDWLHAGFTHEAFWERLPPGALQGLTPLSAGWRRFGVVVGVPDAEVGAGPPLLLLHGYPQTHAMWHRLAPRLAAEFTVVAADLRGYGDSSRPPTDPAHLTYSKRAMAQDMVELMDALGFARFAVAGHDRGARVVHRLCLDHPARVERAAVLDIAPTYTMFATADKAFGDAYYHWFFLSQPYDLPERLIGADPAYYLWAKLHMWGRDETAFTPAALAEYQRCFVDPTVIHASCEDYRAAASIDLVHDQADLGRKVTCPLLVLWGGKGFIARQYDVLAVWRERAADVRGQALPCGHFLPEEAPEETYAELRAFFGAALPAPPTP